MNNEIKTHLIADESLGGLKREYVEVDRKAGVGDSVLIVSNEMSHGLNVGDVVKVTSIEDDGSVSSGRWYINDAIDDDFVIIAPTDIVVIDEQRYRLVDRKASFGEKVVITERKYDTFGRVFTISGIDEDGDLAFKESDDYYAEHGTYSVLVPVEDASKLDELLSKVTPENRHIFTTPYDDDSDYSEYNDCITADENQASPSVIETLDETEASPSVLTMLANLAQRIVELESQNHVNSAEIHKLARENEMLYERVVRLDDEIDTLHSNQKRLGEELANVTAPDESETIVELTKILVDVYRANAKQGSR